MANHFNSIKDTELNPSRRTAVVGCAASVASMLVGPAAASTAETDAPLFAAIAELESDRQRLAELSELVDRAHDAFKARKADVPPALLEPLDMPFGPMRPRPNPQEPGWTNETLWQYIDKGVLPGPVVVRGEDGLLCHYDGGPIAAATIERAKELRAMRQAHSEAVATAEANYDAAWLKFDRLTSTQFERLLTIASIPARTAAGVRAKCAVLLSEPMLVDDLAETDNGTIIHGLIADLQALAATA